MTKRPVKLGWIVKDEAIHEGFLKVMLVVAHEMAAEHKKCNMELEAYYLVTQIQWGAKRIADLTRAEAAKIVWFMLKKMDDIEKRRHMLIEGGNGSAITGIDTSGGGSIEKPAGDGSD